jgi:hypothetical protein
MIVVLWFVFIAALVIFIAANSAGRGPLGKIGRRLFEVPVTPLATIRERVETRTRLEATYQALTSEEEGAVGFLFNEVKAAFETTQDGIKNLDAKAGSLVGIVTTGLGALALLGDGSKLPGKTPFLFIGLGLLALALFAAVLALPTRGLLLPNLSTYALLSTLGVEDNRVRIQFELIEAWLQDIRRARAIAGGKARLLLISAFAIVFGVLSLTVNWAIGISAPAQPSAIHAPATEASAPPKGHKMP